MEKEPNATMNSDAAFSLSGWLGLGERDFWKGAVLGAAVVLLLTSDAVRHLLFGSTTKASEPPAKSDPRRPQGDQDAGE